MNYGVMYEYAVDRNSGQFKAPFNQIKNETNVFTYKDTAIVTPTATRPIPLCGWTASGAGGPFGPGRGPKRLLFRHALTAIPQTRIRPKN